jgi:hypothetical protein
MSKMRVEPPGEVAQRHEAVVEQLNPASAAGWLKCGA